VPSSSSPSPKKRYSAVWNTSPESSAADSAVAIGAPICQATTEPHRQLTVSSPPLSMHHIHAQQRTAPPKRFLPACTTRSMASAVRRELPVRAMRRAAARVMRICMPTR